MTQAIENTRHYSVSIENGRTLRDAFDSLEGEVAELKTEVENGGQGADGIKGEVADVFNSALDILFMAHPEITFAEFDALVHAKNRKWMDKYSKDRTVASDTDVENSMSRIADNGRKGLSIGKLASILRIEVNSVEQIMLGARPKRSTAKRSLELFNRAHRMYGEGLRAVEVLWHTSAPDEATLGEILSAEAIDYAALGRHALAFGDAISRINAEWRETGKTCAMTL